MKCFVVVLAVCVVGAYAKATLSDEYKGKLKEYKRACITETGVSADAITEIINGGPIERDDRFDCFSACMLKKIGIMRADGSIDVDASRAKARTINVDVAKANRVIEMCKDLVSTDTCRTGGNVFGCFIVGEKFPVLV